MLKREHNRGRLEIRFLECLKVPPAHVGFPGARLAARLETRVKRNGHWGREGVYLVSSFTLEELQAEGMLSLKRGYWVVESRLHHCLDITCLPAGRRCGKIKAACAPQEPHGFWEPCDGWWSASPTRPSIKPATSIPKPRATPAVFKSASVRLAAGANVSTL